MGRDFYQRLPRSAFIRGLAAALSLKMPSALTCSSNIENFIEGICSLMTKYFNRFDGTRTSATDRERCTGFRKGSEGDRKSFSIHRESTRKNSRSRTLINQYKRRCDSSAFICVHLRLLKILLLITPKYRLTLRLQSISRICQSLREWLLRVHENASRIASRHPRNRAARMGPRPGEEQIVDRRFVIRQLR